MVDVVRHWAYDMLKKLAEEEGENNGNIEQLKYLFAGEIDSPRRLECIRSIPELIDCLERRDALSEYNIDPLFELSEHFSGAALPEALLLYQVPKEVTSAEGLINEYREIRLAEELTQQLNISKNCAPANNNVTGDTASVCLSIEPPRSPYSGALTEQKRTAIYKVLAKELGNFWRRFGRELEVSEGAMDELEMKYPRDLSSRVYCLLQQFEEDPCHDSKQGVLLICRALEGCQRKDLSRKVEIIVTVTQ